MMMNSKIIFGLIGLSLAVSSCYYMGPCVSGEGPVTSDIRYLDEFTGVLNTTSFEVIVSHADTFGVEVMAQENLLPLIETYVSGATLRVDTKNSTCLRSGNDIRIYVSLPQLEEASNSGSGVLMADILVADTEGEIANTGSGYLSVDTLLGNNISVSNSGSGRTEALQIEADYVRLNQSGSGVLRIGKVLQNSYLEVRNSASGRLEAELIDGIELEAIHSGSGPIDLYGYADEAFVRHTSSGRYDALDMELREAEVHNTGSGRVNVWVTEYLDAYISGSGDIVYKGSPRVSINDSGSGNLIQY